MLSNIHKHLPHHPGASTVNGFYEYYHYGHQNTNDIGWGCAYRSAQTILSWMKAHFNSTVPIPTITQIQEALIHLHDKPPSFLNSKQWIGSCEIFLLIDYYFHLPCKIVKVSKGQDVDREVGHILTEHFQKQQCPVMVGGSQGGAKTILGIQPSCSIENGIEYLILDPHYTGIDDVTKVTHSWCFWASNTNGSLFHQDAWYNFLLPQIVSQPKLPIRIHTESWQPDEVELDV